MKLKIIGQGPASQLIKSNINCGASVLLMESAEAAQAVLGSNASAIDQQLQASVVEHKTFDELTDVVRD